MRYKSDLNEKYKFSYHLKKTFYFTKVLLSNPFPNFYAHLKVFFSNEELSYKFLTDIDLTTTINNSETAIPSDPVHNN